MDDENKDDAPLLLQRLESGTLAPHALEREMGVATDGANPLAHLRAVTLRRAHYAPRLFPPETTASSSPSSPPSCSLASLPCDALDAEAFYARVHGACAENVLGFVPLPVGLAGPLLVDGETLHVPMATVEGTLVASTSRGCKALSRGGGVTTVVLRHGMTRAPVLRLPSAREAARLKTHLESDDGLAPARRAFASTTRFGSLADVRVTVAGCYAYLRCECATGDAMGMNMVSKGLEAVLADLTATAFPEATVLGLSGNLCTDKKPAAVNWIQGRGVSVVAEAVIPYAVVRDVLKTTPEALVALHTAKNLVGSALAGTAAGGFHAHAANVVAAVFLACGQDPAQVVVSSNCLTLVEREDGETDGDPRHCDLRVSCTMPSLEVGTVGGATHLPAQRTCLAMLGAAGPSSSSPGAHAQRLARILAATVLAGEVSLLAALSAHHLVDAHMTHNRAHRL